MGMGISYQKQVSLKSLCTQPFTLALIKDSSNHPLWLMEFLINLEEDTDVTIDNDANNSSLRVNFDDDNVNYNSLSSKL